MRLYLHLTGLLVAAPLLLAAEPPLGTVAARGPVTLSGVELPMAGIPAWPIASGDVLATGGVPAWILLNDRGRIAVDPNSRVSFEDTGDAVSVTVLEGFIDADLRPDSRVKIAPPRSRQNLPAGRERNPGPGGQGPPPRARGPFDPPGPPPGVRPRSPNSPCAADPTVPPARRSPCSPAGGGTPPGQGGP